MSFLFYLLSGTLIPKHKETFMKNPLFVGMRLPEAGKVEPLEKRFPQLSSLSLTIMKVGSISVTVV